MKSIATILNRSGSAWLTSAVQFNQHSCVVQNQISDFYGAIVTKNWTVDSFLKAEAICQNHVCSSLLIQFQRIKEMAVMAMMMIMTTTHMTLMMMPLM